MPAELPPRLRTIEDLRLVRAACLEAVWGHGGWPVRNVARLTRSFAPSAPDDVEALASAGIPADGILAGLWEAAEELAVTVTLSGELYQSRSYHVRAADPGVRQLVIVHHGHGDDFAPGGYRLVETAAELLGAGRSVLFMYMPNYGPAQVFPPGIKLDDDRHGPIFARVASPGSSTALCVFVEPVVACLNHLCASATYDDFHMIGLSGGGWATDVCAAVDPRIRTSISVSGSLPLDLRFGSSIGDEEQMHAPFFEGVIGYRDLYTLGGYGKGRSHLQFLHEHDTCCFSDDQAPPGTTTLLPGLRAYEADISARLTTLESGHFEIVRFDDNNGQHQVSPRATSVATATLGAVPPTEAALLFYAASGDVAHSLIRGLGHYAFIGEGAGVEAGYTHLVATYDGRALLYDAQNGRALRVGMRQDSLSPEVQAVSGIGSGWTHVAGARPGLLLLYSASTGKTRTGRIDAEGTFVSISEPHTVSAAFTHVAVSPLGGLLLLDASSGSGVIGRVDDAGVELGRELSNLPTPCTAAVAVNANALFFYDAPTGIGSTALLNAAGSYIDCGRVGQRLPRGCDHVAGSSNGALLLLNSADATGATWHVDVFGDARPVETVAGFGPWSLIAAD